MSNRQRRRGGFTLPEVLVTVAIVAVLAAVVVPAVTQQVSKGDAPSFLATVGSIRTAVASFAADVRKLPGAASQIGTAITTSDKDLGTTPTGGTVYTTAVTTRWRGPYESSGSTGGAIPIGMGWTSTDALVDSLGYVVMTLTKTGAVTADATELDVAVDASNGAAAGLIRWNAPVAANSVKLFLTSSAR